MTSATKPAKPTIAQIAQTGAMAMGIAIAINLVLYFIGSAAGGFPADALTPMGQPVNAVAVGGASIFGGIASTIGYIVLTRFLDLTLARRVFTIGAIVVFLAMAASPFGIVGAPALQIVLLEIMHAAVLGIMTYFFTRP